MSLPIIAILRCKSTHPGLSSPGASCPPPAVCFTLSPRCPRSRPCSPQSSVWMESPAHVRCSAQTKTRAPFEAIVTQFTDTVGDSNLFNSTLLKTRKTDPLRRRQRTKCHTMKTRTPSEAPFIKLTDIFGNRYRRQSTIDTATCITII